MPALCLVPTVARASRASRRLCDAQGGALLGPRVVTPYQLAPGLLAASGDRRPLLTPLAERILAIEAGRAAGGIFAGMAPAAGLAGALASALSELRRGEVSAAVARAAALELGGRAGERLSDLASALERYEVRLADLGALDGAAGLRAAAAALSRGATSEEVAGLDQLVVDGLYAPWPAEWDLIAALAERSPSSHVRLPFFPERQDLCGPAEPMLRRLEGLHGLAVRRDLTVALEGLEPGRDRAPRLARMLGGLATGGAAAEVSEGAGELAAAAGAGDAGEAEVSARLAAELVERGVEAGEILVLDPSPAGSAAAFARAFAAVGVPFARGRGEPLARSAPVRAVRDALAAAAHLDRPAIESLLGSSYLRLARTPARLSLAFDRAGAVFGRGDPEAALRRRAEGLAGEGTAGERAALRRCAEAVGELRRALRPLASPATGREHAARLRAFMARSEPGGAPPGRTRLWRGATSPRWRASRRSWTIWRSRSRCSVAAESGWSTASGSGSSISRWRWPRARPPRTLPQAPRSSGPSPNPPGSRRGPPSSPGARAGRFRRRCRPVPSSGRPTGWR